MKWPLIIIIGSNGYFNIAGGASQALEKQGCKEGIININHPVPEYMSADASYQYIINL
jgi:hypothetical protein